MVCKPFVSHFKWSIFRLFMVSYVEPSLAALTFYVGDHWKGITSFWKYARTSDEGFPRERDYPLMLHLNQVRHIDPAPNTHISSCFIHTKCQICDESVFYRHRADQLESCCDDKVKYNTCRMIKKWSTFICIFKNVTLFSPIIPHIFHFKYCYCINAVDNISMHYWLYLCRWSVWGNESVANAAYIQIHGHYSNR